MNQPPNTSSRFLRQTAKISPEFRDHATAEVSSGYRDTSDGGIDPSLNANLEIGHYDRRVIAGDFDLPLTPFRPRTNPPLNSDKTRIKRENGGFPDGLASNKVPRIGMFRKWRRFGGFSRDLG